MGDEKAAVSFAHENAKALKGHTLGPVLHAAPRSVENECNQATLLQPIGNL